MSLSIALPRFVIAKPLARGRTGYYWNVPRYWIDRGCPFDRRSLGVDLSAKQLAELADALNARFDGWRREADGAEMTGSRVLPGTVSWLFQEYLRSDAFKERVGDRARPDYRNLFAQIEALPTTKGPIATTGDLLVRSITPRAADKLYSRMCEGEKLRRGEKAVTYCKTAWKVMYRLYPEHFSEAIPNPWSDITLRRRRKLVKAAVDREMVYRFAWGAIETRPEIAVAAVICFEWLQRPENVIGHMTWNDYRRGESIRIVHHKTGRIVQHPLADEDGTPFYDEAEQIIARLPRRGSTLLMAAGPQSQQYKPTRFAHLVREAADKLGLPATFSLDACRHGGMTELEEAELTEGQGMALSAHATPRAYRGYAKLTERRVLAATRRRIAHRQANAG